MFDGAGRIFVLGPNGVRVHDAAGALLTAASGASADVLTVAGDGAVLSGQVGSAGVSLTVVGEDRPRYILPKAAVEGCGPHYTLSRDGAYLLASGGTTACAWRTSDSTFAGSISDSTLAGSASAQKVAIRDGAFVSLAEHATPVEVVRIDFKGRELSRRVLRSSADGDAVWFGTMISPAGDRAIVGRELFDLDTGAVISWETTPPRTSSGSPLFSSSGRFVLLGDGVFDARDGKRRFSLVEGSRLVTGVGVRWDVSPDGKYVVTSGAGRALLLEVQGKGVAAVLGPPSFRDQRREARISHLALSGDGTLLLHNLSSIAAFGLRLAPAFSESRPLWSIDVAVNLTGDVSADGRWAVSGGDGRTLVDATNGQELWTAEEPPPGIPTCLLNHLRFSPRATWLAGSSYAGSIQIFSLQGGQGSGWQPWLGLPGTCDAVAFSRDERLMATSAAALYQTAPTADGWKKLWSVPHPSASTSTSIDALFEYRDVAFSPDQNQLLVSACAPLTGTACETALRSVATGAVVRALPELQAPHPAFSPDGSWIVAGATLLHLPSGDTRTVDANLREISTALFTPGGDIIVSSSRGTLVRYCRNP